MLERAVQLPQVVAELVGVAPRPMTHQTTLGEVAE
jgi:hypothetical protein